MGDESEMRSGRTVTRRTALGAIAASLGAVGTVQGADGDRLTVTDYGVDPTGEEPISDALRSLPVDDGDTLYFPAGRYLMDDWFRYTGFGELDVVGDDATIVPVEDYPHNWLFKLGVPDDPGSRLSIEGFDFDFTGPNTGLRALQTHVDDRLLVENVDVVGFHDSGRLGPYLFDVTDPNGWGEIRNVNAPDGAAFTVNTPGNIALGPTGIIVSPYHVGTVSFYDCTLGPFPDNGLYSSTEEGRVRIRGGTFKNSNIANIRLSGDYSDIHGATVVVDDARPEDENQRGIRLDGGAYNWINDTTVRVEEPNGRAISVQSDVEWGRIQDSRVVVRGDTPCRGIYVDYHAGKVDVIDTTVEFDTPGQAIHVAGPSGPGADQGWLLRTEVTGAGDGSAGRHAVRIERGNCTLDRLDVTQTGGDYRRAVKVVGEECLVKWGDYETDHVPVVNAADGTRFYGITSRSLSGYPGLELAAGTADTEVLESTIYGGYRGQATDGAVFGGNVYPDR
jgi:hypothetical protein